MNEVYESGDEWVAVPPGGEQQGCDAEDDGECLACEEYDCPLECTELTGWYCEEEEYCEGG